MNDENVRLPIETYREGNVITKVCVEDSYKLVNRLIDIAEKIYEDSIEVTDSVFTEYETKEGELCTGELLICQGTSQPCITDAFDEEIGDVIAFTKAKLKANIKKRKLIIRFARAIEKGMNRLADELNKIDNNITKDIDKIRVYNPEYDPHIY